MSGASGRRHVLLGAGLLLVLSAGVPFLTTGPIDWAERSGLFLAGTIGLAGATWIHALETGRLGAIAPFTAYVCAVTWLIEAVDRQRGVWFGAPWQYHEDIVPVLWGGIPSAIPVAWYVFAYGPVALLRRFPVGRRSGRRLAVRTGLAALCLVGIDLLVDPLVVSTGAWTWPAGGAWFGVPLLNFAGWFGAGVIIFLPLFALEPGNPAVGPAARRADGLLATGAVAFFVLVAGVSVLRLGSVLPALAAAAAMAPAVVSFVLSFWHMTEDTGPS